MSSNSGIEWTNATWNPVVGCTRASEGCDHCYAVTMTNRLEAMGNEKYRGLTVLNPKGDRHFNGVVRTVPDDLTIPLRWKKPRKVFVNSMSDLFHKDVPFGFIDEVFATMAETPRHTYQILTKRPERMAEYLQHLQDAADAWAPKTKDGIFTPTQVLNIRHLNTHTFTVGGEKHTSACSFPDRETWPLPNVWLGTSVENQEQADKRIPKLLKCPAAVRFLSVEPILGPIDLQNAHPGFPYQGSWTCDTLARDSIHWVIVGGEIGHGARWCAQDWILNIIHQCRAACVPVFVKQLGSNARYLGVLKSHSLNLKDRKGGNPDEWHRALRIRQMPAVQS